MYHIGIERASAYWRTLFVCIRKSWHSIDEENFQRQVLGTSGFVASITRRIAAEEDVRIATAPLALMGTQPTWPGAA
jgi:hypothetical protein